MTDRLGELSDIGVSIWLDDLDRNRLTSGGLVELIDGSHVVGVTTNPAIFDHSITTGAADYAEQIRDPRSAGSTWAGRARPHRVRRALGLRPVHRRVRGHGGLRRPGVHRG